MSLSLRSLSNHDILSRTRALTVQEREISLLLLLHLSEVERRRLHLKQAYRSMFDYCTNGLGYSASAAMRRIRTARCVARFPEVYGLLESNEVNLSTIAQVSRILTVENRTVILDRIRGKSQREVEAIVAEYEPRAALPPDRVRTVVLPTPVRAPVGGAMVADHDRSGCKVQDEPGCRPSENHNRNGCDSGAAATQPAVLETVSEPATLERHAVIQFSASEAFMAKVERVRSLACHRLPANASFEQVFELVLDGFIQREDPAIRQERRAAAPAASPRRPKTDSTTHPRHIPAPVRDQVFSRDDGKCTYTGTNGRRCGSARAVQIDHIMPVARGGPSTPGNLRLLCAYHNRLEAERLMGRCGARDGPPVR